MPNPMKLVNNGEMEMTDEEVAQMNADAEAYDLNLKWIRQERGSFLLDSDRTQIADFPLGPDSLDDWKTYRQALRDYMTGFDRVSTQTPWPKSPIITRVGQAAYDAKISAGLTTEETNAGLTIEQAAGSERTAAENAAGYPGTGI